MSDKMCPYCGGGAMVFPVLIGKPPGGVTEVSLCDDCGRFEWL